MEKYAENLESFASITAEQVETCSSIDELKSLLKGQGVLAESTHQQTGDQINKRIEQVRHGHREPDFITSALGLRGKVLELLPEDKVYIKYTKGSRAPKKKK
jgi:hypothetical protein